LAKLSEMRSIEETVAERLVNKWVDHINPQNTEAHGNYPEHLVPDLYDSVTAFRVYHDLIYEYQVANAIKNLYYPQPANVLKVLKMYYD